SRRAHLQLLGLLAAVFRTQRGHSHRSSAPQQGRRETPRSCGRRYPPARLGKIERPCARLDRTRRQVRAGQEGKAMSRAITGWELPESERDALLQIFAPRYATLVADHVTLRFGTDEDTPLPTARTGEVVGEADDGAGVQALVVRIGGKTDRGDGSHFHITWSLGPGR